MSASVRDEYSVQVHWRKSCSFLRKEIPPFVSSILQVHGLIAFSLLLPCLYFAHSAKLLLLFILHTAVLPRCWVLSMGMIFAPGIPETEECKYRSAGVLLLCSPLLYSMSSSVLHCKSQIDANAGISALATCCQRAGLFWRFSAGFTRIFVGLLIQSSFKLHKKLFLRCLFGRFSEYHVCSGETSFDSKNCFSYGWILLLGQAKQSHQCLPYFCDSVMLRASH